ncbi:cytochrome aa3 quinol oxidase subunit II [Solibacillus sp. FSL H8-0538]|uniref:cytochrome aa3 quinol oxidase subunit II n=1 Tax=Solibacillus sp. FSL H8-0538 TaxID=2921400 RepID=UPI0030F6E818
MKLNIKGAFLAILAMSAAVLVGCEPLLVLDPKGPQAEVQANDTIMLMYIMGAIVLVVFAILIFMLIKYRASKQSPDYEPPHIHGHWLVEAICIGIPVIIVIFLSVQSVKSNYLVENAPEEYADQEPLVIYASSSNWKWHFSYPEQGIETVNYAYIPANRNVEFKLYSYGPITSFWVPQLGGQKYAMSDMVTTLHLAADVEGEFWGRNANFSGAGVAEQTFEVTSMSQEKFDEWVKEVHETAEPLSEEKFEELLEPGHLGRSTYTGTHLEFAPAPEHNHGNSDADDTDHSNHEGQENHSSH